MTPQLGAKRDRNRWKKFFQIDPGPLEVPEHLLLARFEAYLGRFDIQHVQTPVNLSWFWAVRASLRPPTPDETSPLTLIGDRHATHSKLGLFYHRSCGN